MVINHAQSALDCQVIEAENIRALHAKQQDHLRRPDANALEGTQRPDCVRIRHVPHSLQVAGTAANFLSKIRDILCLAERHAQGLQLWSTGRENGFRIHLAQRFLHPQPDGRLGLCGDLLSNYVVDHRGEQIRIDLPINMPDPVNDLAKPPILLPQVGNLSFTVCKIHVMHLPLILCKVIVSFIAYIPETASIPEIFEQRV